MSEKIIKCHVIVILVSSPQITQLILSEVDKLFEWDEQGLLFSLQQLS